MPAGGMNIYVSDAVQDDFWSGDCVELEEFEWRGRKDFRTKIIRKKKVFRKTVFANGKMYVSRAAFKEMTETLHVPSDSLITRAFGGF